MKALLIILLLAISSCKIQVEVLKHMSFEEAFKKYNNEIQAFSPVRNGQATIPESEGEIKIEKIKSGDVRRLLQKSKYSWLEVWAPWCPHCVSELKNYVDFANKFDSASFQLILISSSYDAANIRKIVFDAGYRKVIYVINADFYSHNEGNNIIKFSSELNNRNTLANDALPKHYLYKGDSLFLSRTGKIDCDSVMNILKSN